MQHPLALAPLALLSTLWSLPAAGTPLSAAPAWPAPVATPQDPAITPDEGEAIRAVDMAMRRPETPAEERVTALSGLKGRDSEKVAKCLVQAFNVADKELAELEQRRAELNEQLARMLKGQETASRRVVPPAYHELRKQAGAARVEADGLRDVIASISQRISELRTTAAVRYLLDKVAGSRRHPLALKVKVAQAVGGAGADDATIAATGLLDDLIAVIKKTKDPREVAVFVESVGLMRDHGRPAASTLIDLLGHPHPMVGEKASLALSMLGEPKAIEPMIELLSRSHGQTRMRVGSYLEALTRQQHGISAAAWKRWFADHGAKYLAGEMPLGGGAPSHRKTTTEENYYFGIPQDGKSIIYVIDSSGSMKAEVELTLPGSEPDPDPRPSGGGTASQPREESGGGGSGGTDKKTTRLEACKEELIRALGRLEPSTRFNVIWFADLPYQFKPTMLAAEPGHVTEAQDWVRKLQPASSTNIHDSLQMAFALTGLLTEGGKPQRAPVTGPRRKTPEPTPDTIFLLTDGSPTKPDGGLDSTDKIIQAVRQWNTLKSVVIHCIGIGAGVNAGFMRQLAEENGGEFKHFARDAGRAAGGRGGRRPGGRRNKAGVGAFPGATGNGH